MIRYNHWYSSLKTAKYLRSRYFILTALYNISALLYFIIDIPPFLFIVLLIIIITIVSKIDPFSDIQQILPPDPYETTKQIHIRVNKELTNFCWLINKWTPKCYQALIAATVIFLLIERSFGSRASWWLFINLVLLYDSLRRYSKSLLKYALNLYKDY